ncbi:hypothetical protein B0I08_102316 [Glaciihabitans tibetensis]|uniref:DUF4129 domain-containing protein n=1 Tax=Glaciihabitans tibetensis TaxID=1266600 RepID=A0A2T0VHF1_9MICO|nr:hypothetical protein [Glaciihabitans tibetensis]PRY69639.1 hypothetical protein B0I08_102316 [Glaciihabitans tibetensis]
MPNADFFPPVQYNPLWAVLAFVLLALVVAWFIAVPLLTRARPVVSEAAARAALAPAVRAHYLGMIDEVVRAYERAELTSRAAHQRLSALVRGYVHESSGYPASAMTLGELRRLNLPGLTGAVERFYPAEFGTDDSAAVATSAAAARRVVQDWGQLP